MLDKLLTLKGFAETVSDFPDAALGVPDLLAEWDGRIELLLEHPQQLVQVSATLQPPAGTIRNVNCDIHKNSHPSLLTYLLRTAISKLAR